MTKVNNVKVIIDGKDNTLKATKSASKNFKKFEGKLKGISNNISGIFSGLSLGIASGFTLGIDKSFNNLKIQTGLAGKELEDLKKISLDTFKQGFGTDINQVNKAISSLKRELGNIDGKELEDALKGTLLIAEAFDKDVNEVSRTAIKLSQNYGISVSKANDVILTGLQKTGDQYDDFLDTLNEYSLQLSQNGIDYKDFINIVINGSKEGLRNTDEMADMLREFSIRIKENSKNNKIAFKQMGLDYELFKNNLKKGNITIGDSLKDISKKILDIKDPLKQNEIAIALFGTKFEDNGLKILKSVANISDNLGKFDGKVKESSKILNDDLGKSLNLLKTSFYDTLTPLSGLFKGIANFISENKTLVSVLTITTTVLGGIAIAIQAITYVAGAIGAAFAAITSPVWGTALLIGAAITAIIGTIYYFRDSIYEFIKSVTKWFKGLIDDIVLFGKKILSVVKYLNPLFLIFNSLIKLKEKFFGGEKEIVELSKDININNGRNNSNLVSPIYNKNNTNTKTEIKNDIKIEVNAKEGQDPREIARQVKEELNRENNLYQRGIIQ